MEKWGHLVNLVGAEVLSAAQKCDVRFLSCLSGEPYEVDTLGYLHVVDDWAHSTPKVATLGFKSTQSDPRARTTSPGVEPPRSQPNLGLDSSPLLLASLWDLRPVTRLPSTSVPSPVTVSAAPCSLSFLSCHGPCPLLGAPLPICVLGSPVLSWEGPCWDACPGPLGSLKWPGHSPPLFYLSFPTSDTCSRARLRTQFSGSVVMSRCRPGAGPRGLLAAVCAVTGEERRGCPIFMWPVAVVAVTWSTTAWQK